MSPRWNQNPIEKKPSPTRSLERAWHIGKEAGLEFVYIGNVPGHNYDNTYCPACHTLLIRRLGFEVTLNALQEGHCPECGRPVAGFWTGSVAADGRENLSERLRPRPC